MSRKGGDVHICAFANINEKDIPTQARKRVGISFLSEVSTKEIYSPRGDGGFAAADPEWVYVFVLHV